MPGFVVNSIGAGAISDSVKPYYKYTWELYKVFETMALNEPLLYVKEASLPQFDVEKDTVAGASLMYKFAKSVSWADVKLSWYDTTGMAEQLRKWRKLVWTPETGIQPADVYKKETEIRSFAFDFTKPVGWKLFNSWPSAIRSSDLSYTDSDIKLVDVVVTYDWAEETV